MPPSLIDVRTPGPGPNGSGTYTGQRTVRITKEYYHNFPLKSTFFFSIRKKQISLNSDICQSGENPVSDQVCIGMTGTQNSPMDFERNYFLFAAIRLLVTEADPRIFRIIRSASIRR